MTLNTPFFAIVNSAGRILGNGECPAIYPDEPDADELADVKNFSACAEARVVRCRVVQCDPEAVEQGRRYRVKRHTCYAWGAFNLSVFPEDVLTVMRDGRMLLTITKMDEVARQYDMRSRHASFWRLDFHVKIPADDLEPI